MTQRHHILNEDVMLVTSVTHDRYPFFTEASLAREAIDQIYRVQKRRPFILYAFVIMPDHVHLLLRVPEPETISNIMRVFKMGLSFQTGISPLWQKRFHIRGVNSIDAARRYIHANPLKKNLCESPEDYPWSSSSGKWDVSDISAI